MNSFLTKFTNAFLSPETKFLLIVEISEVLPWMSGSRQDCPLWMKSIKQYNQISENLWSWRIRTGNEWRTRAKNTCLSSCANHLKVYVKGQSTQKITYFIKISRHYNSIQINSFHVYDQFKYIMKEHNQFTKAMEKIRNYVQHKMCKMCIKKTLFQKRALKSQK